MHKNFRTVKILFPTLVLISILALAFMPEQVSAVETYQRFGPRLDYLQITVYTAGRETEFTNFKNGLIDIIDWPLDKETYEYITDPLRSADYIVKDLTMADMYNLEFNCMRWPTSDVNFRRAIAHIINKQAFYQNVLKSFSGALMDSPIPTGCGLDDYYEPNCVDYDYNVTKAAEILDAAGYQDWDDCGFRDWKAANGTVYPLPPLKFYIRLDDPDRDRIGTMIEFELAALQLKMDPTAGHKLKTVCWAQVMMNPYDYHMYTGGWGPWRDPDYLYDMYHRMFGVEWLPKSWANNYVFFTNSTFDAAAEELKFAPNRAAAIEPAKECQRILMENVPMVPLWHSAGASALRSKYGDWSGEEKYEGMNWAGSVNSMYISGMSNPTLNSRWTFMNVHAEGFERGTDDTDGVPMTFRYGFMTDAAVFNPIHGDFYWDWEVLDKIYDYLTLSNPYTGEDIPWMTTTLPVPETWDNAGQPATKITYNLRNNILWNDGERFTSADVEFTINYMRDAFSPLFYTYVEPVKNVTIIDDYTCTVYYNIQSCFALHWLGGFPMIPKHVWEDIPVGVSREQGEYESTLQIDPITGIETGKLTGTGPFKFVKRKASEWILLEENALYFRKLVRPDFCRLEGNSPVAEPSGTIDMWDFLQAAGHYGCTYPWDHPTWDAAADVNKDLKVELDDIMEIGVRFGDIGYVEGYPTYYFLP